MDVNKADDKILEVVGTPDVNKDFPILMEGMVAREHEVTNMSESFNIRDFLDTSNMTEAEIDCCEFWVTANRFCRESGCMNFEGKCIIVNNEWNLEQMEEWLADYEDKK